MSTTPDLFIENQDFKTLYFFVFHFRLTQTGLTENVSKTVRARDVSNLSEDGMATKRESSHEYD